MNLAVAPEVLKAVAERLLLATLFLGVAIPGFLTHVASTAFESARVVAANIVPKVHCPTIASAHCVSEFASGFVELGRTLGELAI